MIKVLIADDQELIRQSLEIVLQNRDNLLVTGSASDGQAVLESIEQDMPDIILMDIRMPRMDGVQCTKIIKDRYPQIKIIIVTTFDDEDYVFNALKNGASGYLLKGVSMDELVSAIETVYGGQAMINPDIAATVPGWLSQIIPFKFMKIRWRSLRSRSGRSSGRWGWVCPIKRLHRNLDFRKIR